MSPLVVDPYSEHPSTGRFAVRDLNTVIAVGMVKSVVKAAAVRAARAPSAPTSSRRASSQASSSGRLDEQMRRLSLRPR